MKNIKVKKSIKFLKHIYNFFMVLVISIVLIDTRVYTSNTIDLIKMAEMVTAKTRNINRFFIFIGFYVDFIFFVENLMISFSKFPCNIFFSLLSCRMLHFYFIFYLGLNFVFYLDYYVLFNIKQWVYNPWNFFCFIYL